LRQERLPGNCDQTKYNDENHACTANSMRVEVRIAGATFCHGGYDQAETPLARQGRAGRDAVIEAFCLALPPYGSTRLVIDSMPGKANKVQKQTMLSTETLVCLIQLAPENLANIVVHVLRPKAVIRLIVRVIGTVTPSTGEPDATRAL
jgi:hypothetical protein